MFPPQKNQNIVVVKQRVQAKGRIFHAANLHTVHWANKLILIGTDSIYSVKQCCLLTDGIMTIFTALGKTWCKSMRRGWRRRKTRPSLSASCSYAAWEKNWRIMRRKKWDAWYFKQPSGKRIAAVKINPGNTYKIKRMKGDRHIFNVHLLICWWTNENCMWQLETHNNTDLCNSRFILIKKKKIK